MDRPKVEIRLILMTTSLIMVMGMISVSSWYILPPSDGNKASNKRKIASLISLKGFESKTKSAAASFPKMSTLRLGCLASDSSTELIQSSSKQIRITGEICHKYGHSTLLSSMLINKSNEFEGTIFSLGRKGFTSDYIYLKKGLNKLHFSYTLSSGKSYFSEVNIFNTTGVAFKE
ncbi:MAG: hypothetical protein HOO06_15725 [Bdellovibrionaceae bacterium]|jgi:hypothetical protein|nr:hypothetical protein [Pseudobdellovibrionaceae bacterium]